MSYADILQDTLEYIDANLCEELSVERLASRVNFSLYHFSRVFHYGTGYTVMDYVRRRRLAFAASELSGGGKVIDIALGYGFETHSGFSKAFRRYYGCSPETYRIHAHTKKPDLPSLPHIKKYVSGGIVMEPKIMSRPAFKIAGYSIRTTNADGQNSTEIPAFWQQYVHDGRCEKMHKETFLKSHAEYGVCFAMDENGAFSYAIGCEPQDGCDIPAGYEVFDIPGATYAVFSSPPSDEAGFVAAIQGTWGFIFNEWFPKSGSSTPKAARTLNCTTSVAWAKREKSATSISRSAKRRNGRPLNTPPAGLGWRRILLRPDYHFPVASSSAALRLAVSSMLHSTHSS